MAAPDPTVLSTLTGTQVAVVAGAIGAVVAALVSALFGIANTWLVKRAENQRALRELVFKYAVELHNQHLELAKREGKGATLPIDAYLVHLGAVVEILLNAKVTKANVIGLLDRVQEIAETSNKHLIATRDYRSKSDLSK